MSHNRLLEQGPGGNSGPKLILSCDVTSQTSHEPHFRTGVGRESARRHGQRSMPLCVLGFNLSPDGFVSAEAGETSRTEVSLDPHGEVFYRYPP